MRPLRSIQPGWGKRFGPGFFNVFLNCVLWRRKWIFLALAVLVLGYVLLLRTRRGATWLGHRVRADKSAIRPRFALGVWLVFVVACVAAAFAVPLLHVQIPYGNTILGAVLAIVLIGFGQHLRRGLAALIRHSRSGGAPDGHA